MPALRLVLLLAGLLGLVLGGCSDSARFSSPEMDANFTPKDRELLANPPYAQADIPEQFRRRIVDFPNKQPPGTILVNSDARYLYYVLPDGKAVRYGVAVGNEALAWSGVATVGRMTEWPDWIPTPDIRARVGPLPDRVPGGPANPLGARALYLFQGKTDTLYRIHGTNQPEFIGQAVSSGCIRMTNEDVIDLYSRAKLGATVIVFAPTQGGQGQAAAGPRG
jgi:lipoprotein-anchoring transpeptidase ErfK/SrfK